MTRQKTRLMTNFKYEMQNEFQMSNTKFFAHLDFSLELTFGIVNLAFLMPDTAVYGGR